MGWYGICCPGKPLFGLPADTILSQNAPNERTIFLRLHAQQQEHPGRGQKGHGVLPRRKGNHELWRSTTWPARVTISRWRARQILSPSRLEKGECIPGGRAVADGAAAAHFPGPEGPPLRGAGARRTPPSAPRPSRLSPVRCRADPPPPRRTPPDAGRHPAESHPCAGPGSGAPPRKPAPASPRFQPLSQRNTSVRVYGVFFVLYPPQPLTFQGFVHKMVFDTLTRKYICKGLKTDMAQDKKQVEQITDMEVDIAVVHRRVQEGGVHRLLLHQGYV